MHFELVTLNGAKFAGDVYEVLLPTMDGQIGVLPGHMPLVSVATSGIVSIRRNPSDRDDRMEHYATNGGVIEVRGNVLRLLVDEADHETEINETEVQKAIEEAKRLKAQAKDQVSIEHAQSLIDRHEVRLHVAGLRRHKRR
ncbi:ATP synthase F1 subunit epsilon [Candidatus Saccharibacteria bacterium]|nr:ATP synthase F1 subunit epsilon [Candidatus Saccharibacteria bacterium]